MLPGFTEEEIAIVVTRTPTKNTGIRTQATARAQRTFSKRTVEGEDVVDPKDKHHS